MHAHSVAVRDVSAGYGNDLILDGLDLTVAAGELVAILGPNGAGKTTFLEILEGFREPISGDIKIFGDRPKPADAHWQQRVGVLFQLWRDYGAWRVCDVLQYLASHFDAITNVSATIERQLREVDLLDQAHQKIGTLSGGQRRRLDFAIATLGEPELLFLDEPGTGLDPESRDRLHQAIHARVDQGCAVLLTTHDLAEAEKLANRVAILVGGHFVVDDSVPNLQRRYHQHCEVRWQEAGQLHVHSCTTPEPFVRDLLHRNHQVTDLVIERTTLTDIYRHIVQEHAA